VSAPVVVSKSMIIVWLPVVRVKTIPPWSTSLRRSSAVPPPGSALGMATSVAVENR
jgi:hypothetical protein